MPNKKEDFIVNVFKSKLEAKDTNLIDRILQKDDPSEVRIAINEFAHHLKNRNNYKTLYWLNWILEWERINRKKYNKFLVLSLLLYCITLSLLHQVEIPVSCLNFH